MFKRDVQSVKDLILRNLREQGLEMPLLQKRLVEAWPQIAGQMVQRYTLNTYIYNQTLYVRLSSPALRSELSMCRQDPTYVSVSRFCGQFKAKNAFIVGFTPLYFIHFFVLEIKNKRLLVSDLRFCVSIFVHFLDPSSQSTTFFLIILQ